MPAMPAKKRIGFKTPMTRLLHFVRLLPATALIAALLSTPVIAVQHVRGGANDGILEGTHEMSNGSGFIIMMSLRRSR